MATAVTTFAFATTLQSWSSIAALASGETNGLDTVNGNPADALFGKLVGKTKATTAGAGMKFSQALSAWGVPAGATVTAVSVALDKKCVTAPGSAIGSGSFNTKLNLNAGASLNTGPTQTLSTTADTSWTTLAAGSNAALSGLSDSTLTHLLEVDILYTLSTTSSALTGTTWQIDWDNVVVTITYSPNVPSASTSLAGTPGGTTAALTWTDGATNGAAITDHHVYVYDAPSGGSLLNTIDTTSASAAYTVTGLTPWTAYYFEVTSTNSAGESAHSARSAAIVPSGIIQSAAQNTTGGFNTSISVSLTGIVAGHGLLLIAQAPTGATLTVTDGINTWQPGPLDDVGTLLTYSLYTFLVPNAAAGSITVTVTGPNSTYMVLLTEYQTPTTGDSLAFDGASAGGESASGFSLSTSPTSIPAGDAILEVISNSTGGSTPVAAHAGYTLVASATNASFAAIGLYQQIQTTPGVVSDTFAANDHAILFGLMQNPHLTHPLLKSVLQAVSRASIY